MQTLKAAALAGLLVMSGTGASMAATIDLGTFTGTRGHNSTTFGQPTDGSFNDLFQFTLTAYSKIAVSVTNGFADSSQIISPFTLSLFGDASGTGPATKSAEAVTNFAESRQTASLSDVLGIGTYSFRVSGLSGNTPSYGGSFSITISPVPLPASAPLFGGALLALGVAGYGLSRRKAAA